MDDECTKLTRETFKQAINNLKSYKERLGFIPTHALVTLPLWAYQEVEQISKDRNTTMEHAYWIWRGVMD